MTIPALIQLMQEAAMQNVVTLKLSVWDLEPHDIAWVLMRKKLVVHRLPMLGETIKIQTYPAGFEKIFTHRDFKIYDADNKLIATAATTWLLIDTVHRKMTRIPDFILKYNMPQQPHWLERPPAKLSRFNQATDSISFTVNWHDLDFNGHLNNTYYIQWMLEAIPSDILQHQQLVKMDIQYRMECYWKDVILSEMEQIEESVFRHRLVRKEDGKELAIGVSMFNTRQ
jgi:acyl-ACP thioesterase